jgi:hypothetical protein
MKRVIFTSLFLLGIFFIQEAKAQSYESAVGVRAGYYFTGTYKKFLNESNAFEAYLGLSSYYGVGVVVGALYQIHKPLDALEVDNLQWYYGGGAYAGTGSYWANANFYAGVNLNIGLDYRFDEFPINVSADWAPGLNLVGGFRPSWAVGGLAVRYILGE